MKPFLMLICLSITVVLTGCGKGDDETTGVAVVAAAGACAPGSGWSAMANTCLSQASCGPGMGLYTGATNGGYGYNQGTCVPVTATAGSTACQGTCPVGQVQVRNYPTPVCLPQASCPSCQGFENGVCYRSSI